MLNLSTVEAATASIRDCPDEPPRTEITRRHSEELLRNAEDFGEVRAELFSCRAQGMNELEVSADTHSVLLRCDGTASRFEVSWSGCKHVQRLSEFRPGWVVFSPATCCVRVSKKDQGNYRYISVYVPTFAFDQLNDDKLDATQLVLAPQAGPCNAELCRVVLAMKDEIDNPGPMGTLYRDTLGLQVLIHLVRSTACLTVHPPKGGLPPWRLRRALEMLEANLAVAADTAAGTRAAAPSIRQLSAAVGLSPAHFCTAFRQSTGYSPHRYLVNRKIAYAKELMADQRLSLTEIAFSSGFGSSSQFSVAFRRVEGVTPSAYRRDL
jgi:AraC-like DNA-binding protein